MSLPTKAHRWLSAIAIIAGAFFSHTAFAQPPGNGRGQSELNSGWVCKNIAQESASGERLSARSYPLTRWMPATVPGTVLTTMLNNKLVPDPFYGMNNAKIPDIYQTGILHVLVLE